jgi:hypothetical protein
MNRFEIKRHRQHLAFKFNKRADLFIDPDNEPPSVAMRVSP